MAEQNKTDKAGRPATGAAKAALDKISVGEDYEVFIDQTKKGRVVRGKVVEVAVPIPGFVTDLGVRVIDGNGNSRDVHVKWVVRPWADRIDAAKATYEERAKVVAKSRARKKSLELAALGELENAPDWSEYSHTSPATWASTRVHGLRFAEWDRGNDLSTESIYLNEWFRVESGGPSFSGHFLGLVNESYGHKGATKRRFGIIHGFTPKGTPRVLWVTRDMKFDMGEDAEVIETFDEDTFEAEYASLMKHMEEALAEGRIPNL